MERMQLFTGEYVVEKRTGVSKKTGKPYEMFFLILHTDIGVQEFLLDGRTEMGIVLRTISKMC